MNKQTFKCLYIGVRSTFKFKRQPNNKPCPAEQLSVDEDGDLVVQRSPIAKGIIIGNYNKDVAYHRIQ